MVLKGNKWIFPMFPSFRSWSIPRINNLEILGCYLLLQILAVVVPQDLKTTNNKLRQIVKGFNMVLNKNGTFRGLRVIKFTLYPKLKTWKF